MVVAVAVVLEAVQCVAPVEQAGSVQVGLEPVA
jgi:hypothetical protein